MKSRTSHLIHLLVWLLVLTAYVVVLNGLPQAPVFCSPSLRGWVGLPRPRSGRII